MSGAWLKPEWYGSLGGVHGGQMRAIGGGGGGGGLNTGDTGETAQACVATSRTTHGCSHVLCVETVQGGR